MRECGFGDLYAKSKVITMSCNDFEAKAEGHALSWGGGVGFLSPIIYLVPVIFRLGFSLLGGAESAPSTPLPNLTAKSSAVFPKGT